MQKKILKPISVFILTFLIIRGIGKWTVFSDHAFHQVSAFFSKLLSGISFLFPFSIGDIFYFVLVLGGILFIWKVIQSLIRKNYSLFYKLISRFIYFLTTVLILFNLFWGFNYYKKPLAETFDTELDAVEELKELAEIYYQKSAALREKAEVDENGVFKITLNEAELNTILQSSVQRINQNYPEIKFTNPSQTNLKKSLFSTLFSYLGVSGYFNPFTFESQYNVNMPDSKLLFTQMHEVSHQWGFASEAEANFIGFLLGAESNHPEMEYVANFTAMRTLLNRILWYDPEYVKDFVENRYTDGMKKDREYEIEVLQKYDSRAGDAFSLMNEAFLKLNDQEGLQSYGRLVELLVGFNRRYSSN